MGLELLYRVSSNRFESLHCKFFKCSLLLSVQQQMEKSHVTLLTPFNYFKWKAEMVIQLISIGLYRVTMGPKK